MMIAHVYCNWAYTVYLIAWEFHCQTVWINVYDILKVSICHNANDEENN